MYELYFCAPNFCGNAQIMTAYNSDRGAPCVSYFNAAIPVMVSQNPSPPPPRFGFTYDDGIAGDLLDDKLGFPSSLDEHKYQSSNERCWDNNRLNQLIRSTLSIVIGSSIPLGVFVR